MGAYSKEECIQLALPEEVIALKNFGEDLEFHPATDAQIVNAFCSRKEPFSDKEMESWLEKNQSDKDIDLKINGIQFENESYENLEAFKYLTTQLDSMGQVDYGNQKSFKSDCKKVSCALEEIFGKDISTQILFMQRRFGMNASHIIRKPQESVKWKRAELDTVLLALSDMPPGVLPISKNHPFMRSSATNTGGQIANATVTVFDSWNEESLPFKRAAIVHEMGHAISTVTRLSSSNLFKDMSSWKMKTDSSQGNQTTQLVCEHPEKLVSSYANVNYDEDFAESVFAYRFNPKLLLEASPEKYNLIKAVIFDGVEYSTEKACERPERIGLKIKEKIEKDLDKILPNNFEIGEIASRCGKNMIDQVFVEGSTDTQSKYLESCYLESINQFYVDVAKSELKNLPFANHMGPMVQNLKFNIPSDLKKEMLSKVKKEGFVRSQKAFTNVLSSKILCEKSNAPSAVAQMQRILSEKDKFKLNHELKVIIERACLSKETKGVETTIREIIKG